MQERVLATIDRYGLRDRISPQASRPPITVYRNAEDIFEPNPVDRSFIDQDALDDEKIRLYAALEQVFRMRSETAVILGNVREASKWTRVQDRIDNLIGISNAQNTLLFEFENGNPEGRSILEATMFHTISLGAELSLRSALREELALAKRAGVDHGYTDFVKVVDFSQGFVTAAKIDGIALEDFADPSIKKKSSVPFFQFLAIGTTLADRKIYDEILQDNEDTLALQFPNIAKWSLNVIPTRLTMLMGKLEARIIAEQARNARQPLGEVCKNAARILEGVDIVREKARRAFLNPNDPDCAAIQEITSVFLKSPLIVDRVNILQVLGLNNIPKLFSAYRRAYQLASEDSGEFYFDFAIYIRDFIVEVISSARDILTDEDIDSLLLGYDEHVLIDVDIEDQIQAEARLINGLTTRTSQRFFQVDLTTLDLGYLAVPQLVEITFDKNRPRKFTVSLVYNNDLDEEVEVEYTIDTTKGTFDWNFLEDPAHPEHSKIIAMRNQLVLLASNLLAEITEQEMEKKKPAPSDQITEGSATAAKRERFEDPIYALRKQIRAEQRAAKTQDTEEIDITHALQKGTVKNIILLKDEDIARRVHVGIDDKQAALEAIREYNERDIGKFNRKRKLGVDGKPRYTLRVGNTRVLVREVDSSDGNRNFEIVDIRNRKDVYPKNEF